MKIIKDTQEMDNPCEFGEALRNYCFINDGNEGMFGGKQYGCYSTFRLRSEFLQVFEGKIFDSLKKISGVESAYTDDWQIHFNCYTNCDGTIYLAWFWDGDGVLVIKEGDKIAYNGDCKKEYDWFWEEDLDFDA